MGPILCVFCLENLGCWMGSGGEDFYQGAQKDPLFRHSGQVESGAIDRSVVWDCYVMRMHVAQVGLSGSWAPERGKDEPPVLTPALGTRTTSYWSGPWLQEADVIDLAKQVQTCSALPHQIPPLAPDSTKVRRSGAVTWNPKWQLKIGADGEAPGKSGIGGMAPKGSLNLYSSLYLVGRFFFFF